MNYNLCVFDLDGTLYPKESTITHKIREKVIAKISQINQVTISEAEMMYKQLPLNYPNPYHGLNSLNLSGDAYRSIFNSILVEKYMHVDESLRLLLKQISGKADIVIVSFAPEQYINRMLEVLGVKEYVKCILSVNSETNYTKEPLLKKLIQSGNYKKYFSIGDDLVNDITPSKELGYIVYHVDFTQKERDIYSVLQILDTQLTVQIPRIMRVENIAICNEKCIICPYDNVKRKKGIMSEELFRQIVIEHSSSVNNPKLLFPASIGEPFLDKNFFDKLKFASKYYSNIATFTNASILTEENFDKYVSFGGKELMLTLHGFSKEMHSKITNTDLYLQVRSNIEAVARKNYELGNPITIYLDIYADDSIACQEFVSKMQQLNVIANHIPLENTHNWGGMVSCYSRKNRKRHCNRIYEQFGVQFDGKVVPCCIDVEGKYILGKMPEMSLNEIFSSQQYKQLVSKEQQGMIHECELCVDCNI